MTATNERVERFKAEAAELNLKAGNTGKESQLQTLGVVLMVIGIVGELYEIVQQVAAFGVSILVVEQFATAVLGIADLAAIMLHGEITAIGAPSEIEAALSSAYLGG